MKKNVAVISLDAYAGQFYAQQVQELFGDRIAVCSYSVRDGSVEHMPRKYDLYMVTTDAFDSLGDMHRYVPIDGEMMEIHVTLRWDVVHRQKGSVRQPERQDVPGGGDPPQPAGGEPAGLRSLPSRRAGAGYEPV